MVERRVFFCKTPCVALVCIDLDGTNEVVLDCHAFDVLIDNRAAAAILNETILIDYNRIPDNILLPTR